MSHIVCKHIPSKLIKGKLLFYNPFSLLGKENKVLVLMLHFAHLGTWILLLTKWLHHKKIILWGAGDFCSSLSERREKAGLETEMDDCLSGWYLVLHG